MRVNTPILTDTTLATLELGYRTGKSHCYRSRCHVIILKSENRHSVDVGKIIGMHPNTVNSWVKRFNKSGIDGLQTVAGRGRKPLISVEADGASIKELVTEHRQRVSIAQAEWETAKDTKVSRATFRRFLKELADDISESASVAKDDTK
jgi:transposase